MVARRLFSGQEVVTHSTKHTLHTRRLARYIVIVCMVTNSCCCFISRKNKKNQKKKFRISWVGPIFCIPIFYLKLPFTVVFRLANAPANYAYPPVFLFLFFLPSVIIPRREKERKKERGKILWCVAESRDIQVTGYGRLDERMSGGAAHEPMRGNRRGARDDPTQDRNSAVTFLFFFF